MSAPHSAPPASYSIFAGTIADMTWPAVEQAGERHLPILVPIGVIEQHGHHLPLGTDTYGAHLLCLLVKAELTRAGLESVVAPPFYYGLNTTTGMFPGSLTVRPETMVAVLTETLENYAKWGFERQLIINHHGDPEHNRAIIKAVKATRSRGAKTTYVVGGLIQEFLDAAYESAFHEPVPLEGDEIVRVPDSQTTTDARKRLTNSRLDFDVHAAERETSLIMRWFPELLSQEVPLADIEPVPQSLREFARAESEGTWRELSPWGHIGDPAMATVQNGDLYVYEAADMARALVDLLQDHI
jgi:creatinine amidohydrolase